jgi:phosphonatase-like hydrolase
MQSPFKLVVFDIAGTTIQDNAAVAETFMYAMQKHGYPIKIQQANAVMGYRKNLAIENLLMENYPAALGEDASIINAIHETFNQTMMAFYEAAPIASTPHAEEIFNWLKSNGIKVALNTGFSKIITDTILKKIGWLNADFIDFIISSDEVANGRPAADMIQHIMKATGITDTKTIVKVGDTEVDIAEGRAAGCGLVVSVTTGSFTKAELLTYHPDAIIDDLMELPACLNMFAVA